MNLGYSFTPSTLKYWHLSPLKIVDPENKKVTRVRISALNGNGKYSGFRDFTYNRVDLADYCKSLSLHSISDAYLSSDDSETIYNLLGLRFSTGEVDISVTEVDGVTTYTVTVVDENSLLWYGTGQIVVANLPHVSKFIKTNSLVFLTNVGVILVKILHLEDFKNEVEVLKDFKFPSIISANPGINYLAASLSNRDVMSVGGRQLYFCASWKPTPKCIKFQKF